MWLDATYLKQRQGGRIISVAVIIAVAANIEGRREIIGLNVGLSEAAPFLDRQSALAEQAWAKGREAGDLRRP